MTIGVRPSFFLFFAAAVFPFDAAPVANGGLGLAPSASCCCEPFMAIVGPASSSVDAAGRMWRRSSARSLSQWTSSLASRLGRRPV